MNEIPLKLTYRLPALCGSERDEERLRNMDIERMDRGELTTEAWRLRLVLAFGNCSKPSWARGWITERLERIRAALKGGSNER